MRDINNQNQSACILTILTGLMNDYLALICLIRSAIKPDQKKHKNKKSSNPNQAKQKIRKVFYGI